MPKVICQTLNNVIQHRAVSLLHSHLTQPRTPLFDVAFRLYSYSLKHPEHYQIFETLSSSWTTLSAQPTIQMSSSDSSNADALNLTELRVALDSVDKTTPEGTQHSTVQPSSQESETKLQAVQAVQDELNKLRARIKAAFGESVNSKHPSSAVLGKEREAKTSGVESENEA
jgi:hypothetical protein